MRVAVVSEVFLPKLDGVVLKVQHLLEHLNKRQHTSILFAPYNRRTPAEYAGAPIKTYPSMVVPFYPELRVASPFARLEEELAAFHPDIVHLINPTFLGLAGLRAAQRLGIPVIGSYHTDMSGFAREWNMGIVDKPIHAYYRWIHNQCDANLAASYWTKNELTDLGYRRMGVWHGGVDVDMFTPAKRTMAWRVRLSRGETKKVLVITVSRLSKEKRIEMLLPLVKENPNVCLAIIGDGPYRNELVKMFEGTSTAFTGYLQGEELAHAYAAADVFVFNGKRETFGNVVLEAMASGLPVVVPNTGGVTDLVTHGVNGLLYQADQPQGMVQSVKYLLHNPSENLRMGMAGRGIAEKRTWETMLDEVVGSYEQVIASRKLTRPKVLEKIELPQAWQQFIQDIQSYVFRS